MYKKFQNAINLQIETLSPVSIYDREGSKLSPFIDVVIKDDEAIMTDGEKLYSILYKKEDDKKAIDEYMEYLRKKSSANTPYRKFDEFLCSQNINIDDIMLKTIPCNSHIINLTEINQFIKSNGKPYIPGSSLKGTIRTAILTSKITKENYKKLDKDIPSKEYVSAGDYKKYVGESIFRDDSSKVQHDVFKYMIVRDTNIDNNIRTAIYDIRCISLHINKDRQLIKFETPILSECISAGEILKTQIVLKNSVFNIREMFLQINLFYRDVIEKEYERISKIKSDEKDVVLSQYNVMLKKISDYIKSENGCIMRIGNHKGYYSNTIGIKLNNIKISDLCNQDTDNIKKYNNLDKNSKLFKLIRKKYKLKNSKYTNEFPVSQWVVCNNNKIQSTLGWIEVKIDE